MPPRIAFRGGLLSTAVRPLAPCRDDGARSLSIKLFFRSGRWRPWAVGGAIRATLFVLMGFFWFLTGGLILLFYPEAWLSDLHVASFVSHILGAVWLPSDGSVSLSLGVWVLPLIVADTLMVGYASTCIVEALRQR